jgi:hypothetical protein
MPEPIIAGVPLPAEAATCLKEILTACGLDTATVTSAGRSVADQARIMFSNLEEYGVVHQKALYKLPGQRVIDVYAQYHATMPRNAVESLMIQKILEVGSANVSHHIVDLSHWVFDVAPTSIPPEKREAFIAAAATHPKVSKFLKPPADPAFHLEVRRAGQAPTS